MKDYIKIIEDNKEEMLQTLADLVAIPSVVSAPDGDYPYVPGAGSVADF